jgi:LysM domain/Transglycosylase-like domain
MRVRTWAITAMGAAGLAVGLAGPALASTHTVQTGETLSGIAAQSGVSLAQLEAANPQITNPNLIYTGNLINVPDGQSGSSAASSAAPAQQQSSPSAGSVSTGSAAAAPTPAQSSPVSTSASSGGSAPSSFQQCVAWRESGNNPTASSSGMYGILPSTWASLGLSGTAGAASVGQQTAAFQQLYAQYGTSPWSPYDGC